MVLLVMTIIISAAVAQNLPSIAKDIIERDSIPEMTYAIITKDSIITEKILGHHKITEINIAQNASLSDYFHLGSNTKAITSFVAAYLVERGKIKWNTKFYTLFPELKKEANPDYIDITLEDLLTHRAKIHPFTSGAEFQRLPKLVGRKQERREKFVKYVLTLPSVKSTQTYDYSNAGYSVAALMMEKVSGESWESLVTKVLKEKLHIDFVFGWPNRNFKNQPFGHWTQDGKLVPLPPDNDYNLNMIEPAGDLSMNITNYLKFIQLNIQGLSGNDNFLKASTYRFLHTAKNDYALGWANYTKNKEQISEHAGSDGTFFAYVQINHKKQVGYIVLVNSGSSSAQNGVFEMVRILKQSF